MSTFMDFLTGGIQSVIPQTVEATAPNVSAGEQPRSARPSGNPFAELFASTEQQYGLPEGYLERTARVESSFNPSAKNPNSSAGGLFQFIDGTAKQYGLADRYDPAQATDAAARLARDNAAILKRTLGRDPTAGELYLAHQQGAGGAVKLLSNPNVVGAAAARLNGGAGLTAGQLAQKWTAKIDGAQPAPRGGSPALAYAATRGRDPRANMPAPDATQAMGQMPMARQMPQDPAHSPDGGARDFILREYGMAPDMQQGAPQGGGMIERLVGGLGGLGGMRVSGGGQPAPADIESLIPANRPHPFGFFGEAAMENQQADQKRQGQIFAAKQLVAQGMSPQDAVAAINSPVIGQQLALGAIGQRRAAQEQAAVQRQLGNMPRNDESAPVEAPPPAPPAAATPQPATAQPAPAQSATPAAPQRLTPNDTVDSLFRRREALTRELEQVYSIPTTDATKALVQGRAESIKKRMETVDKGIDQYATGNLKEYAVAMKQRQNAGEAPVPFEKWDPAAERKAAQGPQSDEITGYRKEVQNLPSYKNMAQAAPVYNSMLEAAGRNTRSADVNLIYGMAKIMDPTSVVRESEMTVAQAIATLPDRLQQGARSLLNSEGRLSDEVRKGIMTEAYSRMNSYKGLFDTDTKLYDGIVGRRGINREDVIPSFGEFKPYKPPEKAGGADGATPQYKTGATATGRDGTKIRFDGTTWVPFQ
jgi:hypothetical protein